LRKVTKNKRSFPNDEAVLKTLFLAIDYITRKWTLPIQNWNQAMAYFLIRFEGRI
jgi:transposase-like protein